MTDSGDNSTSGAAEATVDTTQSLPFPAELAFNAQYEEWDDARKKDETAKWYEANPDKKPKPADAAPADNKAAEETGAAASAAVETGASAGTKPTEEAAAQAAAAASAPAEIDYSQYGPDIKTGDDLKKALDEWREMRAQIDQIKETHEVLSSLKDSPIKSKTALRMNNFFDATGIDSAEHAMRILSNTPEKYKANPLLSLVDAEILSNPALAELDYDKIYRQVAKVNGIDPNTPYEELDQDTKETLEFKSINALKTIGEKTKDIDNKPNYFAQQQQALAERNQTVEARKEAWKPKITAAVSDLAKGLKSQYKSEKHGVTLDLSVAISEDEAKKAVTALAGFMSNTDPSDQGVATVKDAASRTFMTWPNVHKMLESAIGQALQQKKAQMTEEVRKELMSGGQQHVNRPHGNGKAVQSFDEYLETKKS